MKSSRFEVEEGVNNTLLFRDSNNSDLTSLTKHTIGFLEKQSANQNRKRILIVTDIGNDELVCEMFYMNIVKIIKQKLVDSIVFIGNELLSNTNLFKIKEKYHYSTTDDFLSSGFIEKLNGEAILVKITDSFKPNIVLSHLQLIVHDTTLETNFNALFHNIDYFKHKLKKNTQIMCMVKASAYGSGSVEVARAIQHYHCDYLGVAFISEAVDLRKAGIKLPIVVMNPSEYSTHQLFTNNIEPEIASLRALQFILEGAQKRGLTNYPIHIKIDSGMHRAGFENSDLDNVIEILKNQNNLTISSIFSHLAGADDPNLDDFTESQIKVFNESYEKIQQNFDYKIKRHILNSAGIERFPQYQFDMVRLGIGLWGVNCQNEDKLRNVCTLSSRIIQIKTIKKEDTVGYNRRGVLSRDSKIGIIPIGYADGIKRNLSNGVGTLVYKGTKVPIIGNICMDLLMVDITDVDAKEGDRIDFFCDEQPISYFAKILNTIPYEVLTSVSPRIRRVYYF